MRRYTIAFAMLSAIWLYAGLTGIDFGHHWDEPRITASVAQSLRSGVMLPGWYNYPSFCYQLGLVAALPDVAGAVASAPSTSLMKEHIADAGAGMETSGFLLRLRIIFLVLSSLSALWVYLLVLRWRNSGLEALLAAAFLLASWEFAYHARWVAPDAMLASAVALGMLTMLPVLEGRASWSRWMLASAVVAGVATGIKYQGGILLLPLLLAVLLRDRAQQADGVRVPWLRAVVAYIGAFIVTTPGALLDPFRFVGDVAVELRHYATGHWGHSITPGMEHAAAMLRWLVLDAPAPWPAAAALVFVAAIIGAVALLRERRRTAVWFLVLPAAYFAYLAFQQVMIVRNLLLILPFLAVLAARGFVVPAERITNARLRRAFLLLPAALIAVSLFWQIDAAERLHLRRERDVARETLDWLGAHPHHPVILSPALRGRIPTHSGDTSPAANDTLLLFSTSEIDSLMYLPANRDLFVLVSGLPDVNINAYPDWTGDEKVLALPTRRAMEIPVLQTLLR